MVVEEDVDAFEDATTEISLTSRNSSASVPKSFQNRFQAQQKILQVNTTSNRTPCLYFKYPSRLLWGKKPLIKYLKDYNRFFSMLKFLLAEWFSLPASSL